MWRRLVVVSLPAACLPACLRGSDVLSPAGGVNTITNKVNIWLAQEPFVSGSVVYLVWPGGDEIVCVFPLRLKLIFGGLTQFVFLLF